MSKYSERMMYMFLESATPEEFAKELNTLEEVAALLSEAADKISFSLYDLSPLHDAVAVTGAEIEDEIEEMWRKFFERYPKEADEYLEAHNGEVIINREDENNG